LKDFTTGGEEKLQDSKCARKGGSLPSSSRGCGRARNPALSFLLFATTRRGVGVVLGSSALVSPDGPRLS
jgi:hypothetical protein